MKITTNPAVEKSLSSGQPPRLSTTRSSPRPAMCGAMGVSSMRFGVWDTSPLKRIAMLRSDIVVGTTRAQLLVWTLVVVLPHEINTYKAFSNYRVL